VRIKAVYSHLNGHEHIIVHKPGIWAEIEAVVGAIDASQCRTKLSQEKTKQGRMLYSPIGLNLQFKGQLGGRGWEEARTCYWVTADQRLIRKTMLMSPEEQRQEILAAGLEPIFSYNQTDFVKERIAIEVQFGKYSFVAYDLFVKHMAFFVGDKIDVGIEALPMKELQAEMSSGVAYYEGELYNLLRQGRSTPAVPLVLMGLVA
jgi:hypothetical protein